MLHETKVKSVLPVDFYRRYSKIFKYRPRNYHITNLKTVGLMDAFLGEEKAT